MYDDVRDDKDKNGCGRVFRPGVPRSAAAEVVTVLEGANAQRLSNGRRVVPTSIIDHDKFSCGSGGTKKSLQTGPQCPCPIVHGNYDRHLRHRGVGPVSRLVQTRPPQDTDRARSADASQTRIKVFPLL
jgi:hypothetical protein